MDKEVGVNFRIILGAESIIFDECLRRDWMLGDESKKGKKLRLTLRVPSLGAWVDNDS